MEDQDSPQAPLMAGNEDRADERRSSDAGDELPPRQPGKPADTNPGAFVLALTLAAGISGLLFGYDTGVISATLVSIGSALSNRPLTSMDKSIITSSTSLFALVASPLSSVLADKLGRKRVILYADVLFIAGALMQALASTVPVMIAGRCIVGAGVGAASFVVPLYLAEVAPAEHRGRVVTTNVLFITLGQMVAYLVGWAFSAYAAKETGWRWMVGLGAAPAAIQGALVVFMPETPRWLVKVGRLADARRVVQRISASTGNADAVVKEIETEAGQEDEARRLGECRGQGSGKWLGAWRELLGEGKNRRALAIACLLQGLQQLCGFNSLMYFSATIFTLVGFTSPTLTSLSVAVTNFIFTLVALGLIDRTGRRRMLLYSMPVLMLGLLLAAVGFSFLSLSLTSTVLASDESGQAGAASLVLASIMVYVASYALGLGNVPWMQSELFPLAVRSLGSGVATATNWTANFAVGLTFLPLMDALSPSWTFVLYAAVCAVGYVLVWRIYPETAGLSLEEATALLEHGWGVH
ncbi:major facilitator superfamily protein [Hirsutella rhossiliensis]|uniref:Sugar transporter domain-containing protein n=1 Tax=Hirsutella rhossiliensis TaxID=111463 RepID=A0A9P8N4H3_9HYPO|nr:sugar transporter domain-containing protein [Hirsutella rhossiliensis]KAH0968258.1 sugar transporter domain-containing protein [Hirsutella rhossiliensis]